MINELTINLLKHKEHYKGISDGKEIFVSKNKRDSMAKSLELVHKFKMKKVTLYDVEGKVLLEKRIK